MKKELTSNKESNQKIGVIPAFFNDTTGNMLPLHAVVREVVAFMRKDVAHHYRLTIGTDSELLSNKSADFVTAIVIHRIGNGGRYFYRRFELGKFHTLRDRIIREALISVDVAKDVLAEFRKFTLPDFEFEIHADIGENGPTKVLIQEVVGMVRANNFEVKTKPESYAASNVADRHV